MLKVQHLGSSYAGMLLCSVLLAATPASTQELVRPADPSKSVISLAPSPRPQGYLLARHAADSTFPNVPANYRVFAAATVGEDAGVEVLTLNFAGDTRLTRIASKNNDFVVEPGGTCVEGNSYERGGSCTLMVRFNPQGPGHRLGFLTVANTADATPMSFGLTGNGYVPVVSFTPSVITTVPVTVSSGKGIISGANSLAIDGGDIVYIADLGNGYIRYINSSGTITNVPPYFAPQSVAVDSLGDIYFANLNSGVSFYFGIIDAWGNEVDLGPSYTYGTCTSSAPCNFYSVGMDYPANLSMDANDNLFYEDHSIGAAEMPVAGVASYTPFTADPALSLWYLPDQYAVSGSVYAPEAFAVDAGGNLYTDSFNCDVIEEPLYAAETSPVFHRVAGSSRCGFSGDGGQARGAEISSVGQIAFDIAGNLYFTDVNNQRVRRVDYSTGIISTIAGNGTVGDAGDGGAATSATLSDPSGIAVDSQGQVYILSNAPSAGPTQSLRKVGVTGRLSFAAQLKGTTSAANTVNVANTGNGNLTFSTAPFLTGANPSDFAIDPITTSCELTAGATLIAGSSCKIGFVFKPSAGGSRTANVVLHDNTVTDTNTIQLTGTGTLPLPTMSITSPTSTTSLKAGTAFTFAVSVTSTSSTKPTGTVTFKVNGTPFGSAVTLSTSGTASTSVSESKSGSYTLSAVYSGDSNYATDTVSETVNVAATAAPVTVKLSTVMQPFSSCGAVSFSVQVSSNIGGVPTGTVDLISGSAVLASTSLNNGAATFPPRALPPGSHSFVARYGGDSRHEAATSFAVVVTVSASMGPCSEDFPAAEKVR